MIHNIRLYHLLFAGTIILSSACSHNHDHSEESHDSHDSHEESAAVTDEHKHSGEIVMTPEQAKAAGVTTDTIHPGAFHSVISTSGRIVTPTDGQVSVAATVPGIVSFSRNLTEGMNVAKGTPLFTISTSSLPEGDITSRAYIAYNTAKTEYERAIPLAADKIITDKEFQALKAEYETARLAYEAVSRTSGSKGVSIAAPASGYVQQYLVTEGSYVNVGQPLMTITTSRKLNLRAEVPESEYHALGRITSAKFRTSYSDEVYNLSDLNGKLLSYGHNTETVSSYVPVIFEFDNKASLIPGAYVEIFLLSEPRENVISVPVSALTEEQGAFFVYIKLDDECYKKQPVVKGVSDGERVEIIEGIHDGDAVVTKGAIHVKLASASKSIPGHTHNH